MYKISIDTTKRREKIVKLINGNRAIDEITGDIDIVDSIRIICDRNQIDIQDIGLFEPNTGPGSFTGIKMGITVANILNWANGTSTKAFKPNYGAEPNIQKNNKVIK